eukprot:TRINITY_DN30056_c0_g1_i1.p3 TRINITY_DN30056_c0_g1~~TRINITY_DN30056_c0_g1_i1.p3  ORF type:complete len:102 (-),score=3.99 TRINITY_DN30056_c0_g1_i1:35-340(-)
MFFVRRRRPRASRFMEFPSPLSGGLKVPAESTARIGRIIDVRGDGMVAILDSSDQGDAPKVTIGREDVLVGQLGSYVKVVQGAISILAMLTRMSEGEKLEP